MALLANIFLTICPNWPQVLQLTVICHFNIPNTGYWYDFFYESDISKVNLKASHLTLRGLVDQ